MLVEERMEIQALNEVEESSGMMQYITDQGARGGEEGQSV